MKSIFRLTYICSSIFATFILSSCGNFDKEVEIKLPEFKSQLSIEAYIEDNKQIKVAVTETKDYFDKLTSPFVNDATVTFTYKGVTYPVPYNAIPDIKNLKYFNYILKDSFHFQPGDMVYINVQDKNGRMLTAQSQWIEPVKIDSVRHSYGPRDSMALITAHFTDPSAKNYYRFRVINLSDSNHVIQDFFTDDAVTNGQSTAFGTGYRFKKHDTLEVSLFSLPQDFYTFLETANAAQSANGNPFGQPAVIKSNVTGGTGIFSVLPYDRKIFIIP
jgi:hypothetical protein